MESLALTVAIIMVTIVVFGAVALVVAVRRPRGNRTRALGALVSLPAVVAGGWLLSLDVGRGARLLGLLVFVAGASALWRSLRGPARG